MHFKTIRLIHFALCTGVLLFAGVTLFITMGRLNFSLPTESPSPIEILAPIMALIAIPLSQFMFTKLLANLEDLEPGSKLSRYQTALIVKMAILESMALFNIVACLITFNALFLVSAAIVFFAMWASRPTADKLCQTLNLQESDLY